MKKDIKNLKEFKTLIKKYRSITIEQIESAYKKTTSFYFDGEVACILTGFGSKSTCTLCHPYRAGCAGCVYCELLGINYGCLTETYDEIRVAKSSQDLYNAIQNRANYMEDLLLENKLIN